MQASPTSRHHRITPSPARCSLHHDISPRARLMDGVMAGRTSPPGLSGLTVVALESGLAEPGWLAEQVSIARLQRRKVIRKHAGIKSCYSSRDGLSRGFPSHARDDGTRAHFGDLLTKFRHISVSFRIWSKCQQAIRTSTSTNTVPSTKP